MSKKRWLELRGRVCPICGFNRGDKRHGDSCSRKAQKLFAEQEKKG